jgi:hypothetical protein
MKKAYLYILALLAFALLVGLAVRLTNPSQQPEGSRSARGGQKGSSSSSAVASSRVPDRPGTTSEAASSGSVPLSFSDRLKKQTEEALLDPNPSTRAVRIAAILEKLSPENFKGIVAAFAEEKKLHGRTYLPEWTLVVRRAGEVMGREAVDFFITEKNFGATKEALEGWAAKDPARAFEWLTRDASAEIRAQTMGAAIRGLLLSEPDLAITALEAIPQERRKNYTNDFAAGLVRSVGLDKAESLINSMLGRSGPGGKDAESYGRIWKDFATIKIQTAHAKGNAEEAINWLTPQIGSPYVDNVTLVTAMERYARVAPEKAAAWLEKVNDARPVGDTVGYRALLATWLQKSGPQAVDNWVQAQGTQPRYDRIAEQYSVVLAARNPLDAAKWAATIRDPAIRDKALQQVQNSTKKKS